MQASEGMKLSPFLLAQDTLPTYRTWSPPLPPGWELPWGSSSRSVLAFASLGFHLWLVFTELLNEFSWILGFD